MAPSLCGVLRYTAIYTVLAAAMCNLSECYDPLDPNGNITVTFDIFQWTEDGYRARVTLQNFYLYRHVDKRGWKLGWTWPDDEVIWSMRGAFTTIQGNCSTLRFRTPHSCEKSPVIMDLSTDAPGEIRSEDCCHGGFLSAWAVDPSKSFTSFEITVGNLEANTTGNAPQNLTLFAPGHGYTCSPVVQTAPSISSVIGGRRQEQVYRTWKSTCTYSSFMANKKPVCCVSLSAFYSRDITSCPKCSCGCREAENSSSCVRFLSSSPSSYDPSSVPEDAIGCTDHMCPVRVHWHVKNNYKHHWRVKLTVSSFFYKKNYSDWNLLAQHPGFSQSPNVYSFNSTILPSAEPGDEAALFWGKEYYNTILLHSDKDKLGSLSTEILLKKDLEDFTLGNGWAFPRRIYFDGENCEMPLPDTFPMLPNGATNFRTTLCHLMLIFLTYLTFWGLL